MGLKRRVVTCRDLSLLKKEGNKDCDGKTEHRWNTCINKKDSTTHNKKKIVSVTSCPALWVTTWNNGHERPEGKRVSSL